MTYEERAIANFLKGGPDGYVARSEIERKAVKHTMFEKNPHRPDAPLSLVVDQGKVEQKDSGHHELKQAR
jgi:hypothetical protein